MGGAGVHVVELGAEAVAAVDTDDPIERWRLASLRAIKTLIGMFLVQRTKLRRSLPS